MSHGKIRADKTCLNCGSRVDGRFCPNCGQENIETRQPFHYLFTHFFDDFTHYDGQFWKIIKYLIFKPGKLTNEYLSGKRQSYVAPVKLYIFINFVAFLLPTFLPEEKEEPKKGKVEYNYTNSVEAKKEIIDELKGSDALTEEQLKRIEAKLIVPILRVIYMNTFLKKYIKMTNLMIPKT